MAQIVGHSLSSGYLRLTQFRGKQLLRQRISSQATSQRTMKAMCERVCGRRFPTYDSRPARRNRERAEAYEMALSTSTLLRGNPTPPGETDHVSQSYHHHQSFHRSLGI
jgi:hypothetical protein